jgi:hypothetical protein
MWRHIPEAEILHSYRRENLKSHKMQATIQVYLVYWLIKLCGTDTATCFQSYNIMRYNLLKENFTIYKCKTFKFKISVVWARVRLD